MNTVVTAVMTSKGGTGKTTSAVNLAAGLSRRLEQEGNGGEVVLIDLDQQSSVALYYGIFDQVYDPVRNPNGPCVSKVLTGKMPVWDALIQVRENLYVLPSSEDLKYVVEQLINADYMAMRGRQGGDVVPMNRVLSTRLAPLLGEVPFIVLDCPPNPGVLENAIVDFADWIVSPVQLQYLSVAGAVQYTETLDRLRNDKHVRAKAKLLCILPTMCSTGNANGDPRQVLERKMMTDLIDVYGRSRIAVPVPQSARVKEAAAVHQDIYEYYPNSVPAAAYSRLVNRVYECRTN